MLFENIKKTHFIAKILAVALLYVFVCVGVVYFESRSTGFMGLEKCVMVIATLLVLVTVFCVCKRAVVSYWWAVIITAAISAFIIFSGIVIGVNIKFLFGGYI